MKKILIAVALLMVFSLAIVACGGANESSQTSEETSQADADVTTTEKSEDSGNTADTSSSAADSSSADGTADGTEDETPFSSQPLVTDSPNDNWGPLVELTQAKSSGSDNP